MDSIAYLVGYPNLAAVGPEAWRHYSWSFSHVWATGRKQARDRRDSSSPVNPKDTALVARDDHVIAICAKMVKRNPVVVRCEAPRERRKQRDGTYTIDPKDQSAFCDENVARGERVVAAADVDGTRAMYFSRQEPNPGIVANNEAFPLQSTLSMFSEQNSLTSKRSGAAATPVGKGT